MKSSLDTFQFVLPAEVVKSNDGEWRIRGLASTEDRDQQGEVILQHGIDTTPIDEKQGYFNLDHKQGPENLLGVIDGYQRSPQGFVVEGRLFQGHEKAKSVYQIMQSLGKSDRGRVGLSVEGKILERDINDPKIIKKCPIKNVAITFNPVNTNTYADLAKSLSSADIEFKTEKNEVGQTDSVDAKLFTALEVVDLISKALAAGSSYAMQTPAQLSGGDALAKEDLDKQPRKIDIDEDSMPKKKKLKKMDKAMYKSTMLQVLDNIQNLYPDYSRSQIWEALKDRLYKKFPEVSNLS